MPELGFYSLQEASQYLGITIQEVVNHINSGELKAFKFEEKRTRIDEYELMQFRKSRQHDPAVERLTAEDCDC